MIATVQEDENGDLYLEFSPEELEELGWSPGDTLEWSVDNDVVVLKTTRHS